MRRGLARATVAVLLAALVSLPALALGPQAVEMTTPGVTLLSFRTRGNTTVEMRGTERMPAAFGSVRVENKSGVIEIRIGRGDLKGFQRPQSFGRDFLTYVLWVVAADGTATNAGEVLLRDDSSDSLTATTSEQVFWLMVTAEPDFAVRQPSRLAVLVSQSQEQTRTGNKAQPVSVPLLYFTTYGDYDTSAAEEVPVVWSELLQARKAVELAEHAVPTQAPASAPPDDQRARDSLALAREFLSQAETLAQTSGASPEMSQAARAAVQLAEGARALAVGVTGRASAHEIQQLRARVEESERELAGTRDRFTQLEATLDRERRHTRELESEIIALRERITLLEGSVERSRAGAARLEEQQARLCGELRRQLISLGRLNEQGEEVMLDLASDVLFDSGRFELRAAAREGLSRLGAVRALLFPRAALRFEGHTDLVGEEDYNQWLSEQRALSVYRYYLEDALARSTESERAPLEEDLGVAEQLLKMSYSVARRQATQRQELLARLENRVIGKGMREPLVLEKGPNEQNRRVTVVFSPMEPGASVSPCPAGALAE